MVLVLDPWNLRSYLAWLTVMLCLRPILSTEIGVKAFRVCLRAATSCPKPQALAFIWLIRDVAANVNVTVGFNCIFHVSVYRATSACEERVNFFLKKCNLRRSWNSSGSEALDASLSLPSVLKPARSQQGHSLGGKQWSAKLEVGGGEKKKWLVFKNTRPRRHEPWTKERSQKKPRYGLEYKREWIITDAPLQAYE